MRLHVGLAALFCLSAIPAVSHASVIDFTLTTTATGTLNGVAYTNASFVITGSYDTSQIIVRNPGTYNAPTLLTYTIDGFSPVVSTGGDDYIFIAQSDSAAGVGSNDFDGDVMDVLNAGFGTLDLSTPFGPFVSDGMDSDNDDKTTGGDLLIASNGSTTFDAVAGASPVPEPSSLMLLSTGVLGIADVVRRRLVRQ